MPWTVIHWPCEYMGKTLPQVLFKDPDWFFFMIENRNFENKLDQKHATPFLVGQSAMKAVRTWLDSNS